MRDGTKLATNLWLPDVDGPVPVLLLRTPYGKHLFVNYTGPAPNIFELVKHGYAVAVQDCRGTFESEGTFVPHVAEANDGVDTVKWLVDQTWCNGKVGSYGGSYLGFLQWHLAATGVHKFKAMAVSVTSGDLYRAPWYSPGGALSLGIAVVWGTIMSLQEVMRQRQRGGGDAGDLMQLATDMAALDSASATTPSFDHPLIAKYLPWMVDVAMSHPDRDQVWDDLSALDRVSSITTPTLHVGGWYDLFIGETLRGFSEMKANAGSAEAREGQFLIVGPWAHSPNGQYGMYPDRTFGPAGTMDAANLTAAHIALFDHYLRGREGSLKTLPRVRILVMGIDQWRDEQDWPLPDTSYTSYYLDGDGPANTAAGAGTLTTSEPNSTSVDTYLYDPRRPVPSLGGTAVHPGGWDGALDQRPVQSRDDVLCFTSAVLEEPVEVTGPVHARLYVSSSAVDTDFTAKLVDVHQDGRAIILCDGIQRMRYRKSLSRPEMMTPGEVYEITIDLLATSNVFLPGHRMLVEVSSSNVPRYDRNSNTGGIIARERESDMIPAVNKLFRGFQYPSRVILPVINRGNPASRADDHSSV